MKKALFEPLAVPVHHHAGACACEPTIAYVRVSRVGDREILVSPEIQLGYIERNAVAKGKRIVAVVTDIGQTGRTFAKRSVDGVVESIKRGTAKSVTVWKWSRWGRNVEYSLLYMGKVAAVGGRVDSATEDVDPATAVGRFSRGMMMQVDEFLGDLIGEGWQSAHALRRKDGLPHSGRARFGYIAIPRLPIDAPRNPEAHDGAASCEPCLRGAAHFAPHPTEAPRLADMYRRYCAGTTSFRRLATELNDDGFRTALDGPWTQQAVRQLMDTGFAAGYLRSRSASMKAAIKSKQIPASNNLASFDAWSPGSQAPVIDDALWQRYKARRIEQSTLPPRARVPVHALSGLLVCGECAARLSTKYTGAALSHQWHCPGRESKHPGVSMSTSNALTLAAVRQWVIDMAKPVSTGESLAAIALRVAAEAPDAARTRAQVQSDISRWLSRIDKLIDRLTDETISREAFLTKQAEYEATIAVLRAELVELDAVPTVGGRPDYAVFGSLAAAWDAVEPPELSGLLSTVVGMVVVAPAGGRELATRTPVADRFRVVGRWEMDDWDRWLSARRKRPFA